MFRDFWRRRRIASAFHKCPFGIHFRILTLDDLHAVVKLQNHVHDRLDKTEKTFLIPYSEADLRGYITGKGHMYGAFDGSKLIGQSILVLPDRNEDEVEIDKLGSRFVAKSLGILKGTLVHPDYQGRQIQRSLINIRLTVMRHHNRHQAITDVTIGNNKSLRGLTESGFRIVAIRYDDRDNSNVYYLHAPCGAPKYHLGHERVEVADQSKIDFMRVLLENEFVGSGLTPDGAVIFQRSPNFKEVIQFLSDAG